jgi:hypothetical protein
MTPLERQEALRKKAEKKARKGIVEQVAVVVSEPLPEEPAIRTRRRRTQAA